MSEELTKQARAKLAELMSQWSGSSVAPNSLEPVCSGASGRIIMRYGGMIAVYWTAERADNNSFLPAAKGLKAAGLQVPDIFCEWGDDAGQGACIMSNLGKRDILSYKGAPWSQLREKYALAFDALLPLYGLKPTWELQAAFDAEYYGWEQSYFLQHFIQHYLGSELRDEQGVFRQVAEFLAALPRTPVHRDCQSQNIMIHGGKAWLIDFQGMRMGRMEYDLASLIYDPYMDLSESQRLDLLQLWQSRSCSSLDGGIFAACGMQRLMQALGAFANIGLNQGRSWYLEQIPAGLRSLKQIAALAPPASPAYHLSTCLNVVKSL